MSLHVLKTPIHQQNRGRWPLLEAEAMPRPICLTPSLVVPQAPRFARFGKSVGKPYKCRRFPDCVNYTRHTGVQWSKNTDLWNASTEADRIYRVLQVYLKNNVCKIWDRPGHKWGLGIALGLSGLGLTQKKRVFGQISPGSLRADSESPTSKLKRKHSSAYDHFQ